MNHWIIIENDVKGDGVIGYLLSWEYILLKDKHLFWIFKVEFLRLLLCRQCKPHFHEPSLGLLVRKTRWMFGNRPVCKPPLVKLQIKSILRTSCKGLANHYSTVWWLFPILSKGRWPFSRQILKDSQQMKMAHTKVICFFFFCFFFSKGHQWKNFWLWSWRKWLGWFWTWIIHFFFGFWMPDRCWPK